MGGLLPLVLWFSRGRLLPASSNCPNEGDCLGDQLRIVPGNEKREYQYYPDGRKVNGKRKPLLFQMRAWRPQIGVYLSMLRARRSPKISVLAPLLLLLPFAAGTILTGCTSLARSFNRIRAEMTKPETDEETNNYGAFFTSPRSMTLEEREDRRDSEFRRGKPTGGDELAN